MLLQPVQRCDKLDFRSRPVNDHIRVPAVAVSHYWPQNIVKEEEREEEEQEEKPTLGSSGEFFIQREIVSL